ncbi:signal transduction histidine kinase/CheY-like chemotaxis protein [Micromonospora sp. A200]|uniref:ATP-binding protein n=1 Tax=Micromonospora sp. A200 TaxID=2940568 RepID=UPI002473D81C|nr:ATP-binding protein [Micromonospora sp. A200]MDH6463807.1 signal transduction histidine kinase/CheY-like chemotaxis protein [Micromonospora sp. A200]
MTSPTEELFGSGSATGRLMARLDWAATPLGPVQSWPQSLRAAVRIVLSSRYPMLLLWGEQFTQLYNDAYSALIGDKHPGALGDDVRTTLAEGWDVLAPLIDDAMATGVASWVPALQLLLDRSGYREEAYFSVSHAPARDDDGRTVGVFTVCSEVTEQVVGERRLGLLRDLSVRGDGRTVDVASTCARLVEAIGGHRLDVPFAAIYLREGTALHRVACTGDGPVAAVLPDVVVDGDPAWGLWAAGGGAITEVHGVAQRMTLPAGAFDEPAATAVALPLPSAEADQPLGVLVAGVSPSRALDEAYRSFFHLLAQQVAVAVRNARAYEEERRRAEALAELDRVKTSFFTNVSHEFRTPLTLMLGPLTDALADERHPLPPEQRERVDTARRNATRLLTLVNSLLTFSSLEAGRARSRARQVDLPELTAELAGVFRSAVERAGLSLEVDCPPLPRPAALDPANWERIVTNLLSNALKHTFVGRISVGLHAHPTELRLTVADTGIGIAEEEMPRLFERFHRVDGARSRSHEGTGIGLALVGELARLEGGDVRVDSQLGRGSTFTVALPWSALHRGTDDTGAVSDLGDTARAVAQEASGWLVDPVRPEPGEEGSPGTLPDDGRGVRILVADDNADMRAYLARLLTAQGWRVDTVGNGRQALDAIRRDPPDLVLTDVMMPEVDGFALVRTLRGQPDTEALPVVVLSARAGADAAVEGLDLGADDYVVKPFTAADLVARVRATLEGARRRQRTPDAEDDRPEPPRSARPISAAPSPAPLATGPVEPSSAGAATDSTPSLTGTAEAAPAGAASDPAPAVARTMDGALSDVAPAVPGHPVAGPRRAAGPAEMPTTVQVPNGHETASGVDTGWSYPSKATSASAMRRDVRSSLEALHVDPDVVQDLLVAASEAFNNAVEHAQQPSRPEVRVRLQVGAGTARLTVRDFGTWRDRRSAMDRGRGATLMNAFGDVRLMSTASGTTVTIERRLTDDQG